MVLCNFKPPTINFAIEFKSFSHILCRGKVCMCLHAEHLSPFLLPSPPHCRVPSDVCAGHLCPLQSPSPSLLPLLHMHLWRSIHGCISISALVPWNPPGKKEKEAEFTGGSSGRHSEPAVAQLWQIQNWEEQGSTGGCQRKHSCAPNKVLRDPGTSILSFRLHHFFSKCPALDRPKVILWPLSFQMLPGLCLAEGVVSWTQLSEPLEPGLGEHPSSGSWRSIWKHPRLWALGALGAVFETPQLLHAVLSGGDSSVRG